MITENEKRIDALRAMLLELKTSRLYHERQAKDPERGADLRANEHWVKEFTLRADAIRAAIAVLAGADTAPEVEELKGPGLL